MPKITYIERNFQPATLEIIDSANAVLAKYEKQGFNMTLRQVYYQMIAKDYFPETWIDIEYNRKKGLPDDTKNTEKNYDRFGEILNAARLAGLVDWFALTDITRNLKGLAHWEKPQEIIDGAAAQFRMDKWRTQPFYIELWVEKDALINIMEKVCNELDISYFSCRGYTSQSEMWQAGRRLKRQQNAGKKPLVLHFGDHDPSGFDMTRDVTERLTMFAETEIEVKRVALNMDQIIELNAPPNPAKVTDSRAKNYIKRFGNRSWELDAIEPPEMADLVRDEIKIYLDQTAWNEALTIETENRRSLETISKRFKEVVAFIGGKVFEETAPEEMPKCESCGDNENVTQSPTDDSLYFCGYCEVEFEKEELDED